LEFNGKLSFLIPEWCSSLAPQLSDGLNQALILASKNLPEFHGKNAGKANDQFKIIAGKPWKISRENHQEKLEENTASNKGLIKNWKSENGEEKYWKNKFDFSDSSGYLGALQPSPFRAPRRVASFPPILASTRPQIPKKFSLFRH
jgi:hypothetical protein